MPRSTGGAVAVVVFSAVILYALYELRHVWLLVYVAAVLAVMFDPAVARVGRLRIGRWQPHRGLSVAIVAVVVLAVVAVALLLIVPPIASEAGQLTTQWPEKSARMIEWIHRHLPFSQSDIRVARAMDAAMGGHDSAALGWGQPAGRAHDPADRRLSARRQ